MQLPPWDAARIDLVADSICGSSLDIHWLAGRQPRICDIVPFLSCVMNFISYKPSLPPLDWLKVLKFDNAYKFRVYNI